MGIKQKLLDLIEEVDQANDPQGIRSDKLMRAAVEAISKGPNSLEWEEYMKRFASTPGELKRLTLKDSHAGEFWLRKQVVYLVAYATCTPSTLRQTTQKVTVDIELGIE